MSFARLLSEATASESLPRTGDVLAVGLPLLRQIESLHRRGAVTGTSGVSALDYDGRALSVTSAQSATEQNNRRAIEAVSARATRSGVTVAARTIVDHDATQPWNAVRSEDIFDPAHGTPDRPQFVVGYRAWEQLLGHHDQLTDITLAGLWLSSYAFGLDLETIEGVNQLALHHRHPSRLNADIHPVVLNVLTEMVLPDRSRRPTDVGHVIARLEHHRDLPTDLDLGPAYQPDTDWRRPVLSILRDRVFDTTRRNRQLYFRPTASSVSLTEASVPLLLNVDRITADDLLTWTEPSNRRLRRGKPVDLAQWCRFEETPYLAPALAKLISAERKVRLETGYSRLRLIIAFLHWHDPESGETVSTPLLLLGAKLTRKKGVTVRYLLEVDSDDAAVNPILRHVFKTRFDIALPTTVATDPESIAAFVTELERMVQRSAPAVSIELVDKPRIDLLRRQARLRVDRYRRRRARSMASSGRWRRQDHSYDSDDWRPLGLALYQRFVRSADLPMRDLAGAPPRPRRQSMVDEALAGAPGAERTTSVYQTRVADVSAERWEVDLCAVTLAMLGSRRTSLARDYDEVLDQSPIDVSETPFEQLFSPRPARHSSEPTRPIDLEQRLVLPADDAQSRAVQRAIRGDSFIIQGPPGTGKSQTITNVIAALVAAGKRVLFVCEKRAAIDVVAQRLRQVGLGELTATIHDSQLDRKQFVKELGATYHNWLEAAGDEGDPERRRAELLAAVEQVVQPLEAAAAELGRAIDGGMAVGPAIQRLAVLTGAGLTGAGVAGADSEALPADGADRLSSARWAVLRPELDRVVQALAVTGPQPVLSRHLPLRVRPSVITGTDVLATCRQVGQRLREAAQPVLSSVGPGGGGGDGGAATVADLDSVAAFAPSVRAALAVDAVAALDPTKPAHLDLRAAARQLDELRAEVQATAKITSRWGSPLSGADTATALAVAVEKERSPFRFFSGRWRSVRRLVEESYRFDQHQVAPTITDVLTELDSHHQAVAAVAQAVEASQQRFGTADAVALRDLVDRHHDQTLYRHCLSEGDGAARRLDELEQLAAAAAALLLGPATPLSDLGPIAAALESTPVALEAALVVWSGLDPAVEAELTVVLDQRAGLDAIEAGIIRGELDRWVTVIDHPSFSGPRLDEAVNRLSVLHRELLAVNAEAARARVRTNFLDNIAHSEASMAGRSEADKAHKRAYNAGRRIVEREYDKKMRFRSIREMSSGDSGLVVRDLRPVWLMSPLSVSDTLPLAQEFDTVIFDEASQIPVEDAVPSVFRAPQVIVVGDRMQMPPTRFFSSVDDEDGDILVDDEGFRLSISLDADSFLTQADQALDSTMLNWHYRSRSEALIAYSNHAFYQRRLATVPDTTVGSTSRPPIIVGGSEGAVAGEAAANVAEVMSRPISFHYLLHGEYRDRRNRPEADYVAELVRALLARPDNPTIGVVAFSEAQQSNIEDALDELAALDPDFAERYEREQVRVDGNEFVGLFVKNLENVQGDERDIVIMSVCYGPDPAGLIKMNFGPINNTGGERRLNVIFSRAKRHMVVVASMRGGAITNVHNEGANHLARFLQYAEAESIGDQATAQAILESQVGGPDRPGPESRAPEAGAVAELLAARLRDRGHRVETAVGRSSFRIDLVVQSGAVDSGVVESGDGDGAGLGVLLEPEIGASTYGRYLAEAGVLQAFGWRIVRVPLSDWHVDPDRVVERIEAGLATTPA